LAVAAPEPRGYAGIRIHYVTTSIAFLRAVNVAGHGRVAMQHVRGVFAAAGCRHVSTVIQSGNVIFESPRPASAIVQEVRHALSGVLGEEPQILCRTAAELQAIVQRSPFAGADDEPDVKRYVVFLFRRPRVVPTLPLASVEEGLEAVTMSGREVFVTSHRRRNGFFGFPNQFVERALGVSATSRNWSTVTRIADLLRAGRWE
jgi:uncharacterized protein (DUF1697 family)